MIVHLVYVYKELTKTEYTSLVMKLFEDFLDALSSHCDLLYRDLGTTLNYNFHILF